MPSRFSKMLGDAKSAQSSPVEETPVVPPLEKSTDSKVDEGDLKAKFWQEVSEPDRVATIRLNFDIPVELDEKLKAEARKRNTTKTKLVRKMIEFMLDD